MGIESAQVPGAFSYVVSYRHVFLTLGRQMLRQGWRAGGGDRYMDDEV